MKIKGLNLLGKIKRGKVQDNIKIKVTDEDDNLVTTLTYKDNDLQWKENTFRVSMFYTNYWFEIEDNNELKLYSEIKFNDYDWCITAIREDEIDLLMKNRLPVEDIKMYCSKEFYDGDYDVRFGRDNKWCDSNIRMLLNGKFLEKFNLDNLIRKETTLKYSDGKEITTKDYIRLLTKEETENLPFEIRKLDYQYGYWFLSPRSDYAYYAWLVHSTGLVNPGHHTAGGLAVRPAVTVPKSLILNLLEKV